MLRGKVLDSKTGEPIAKALVSIREQKVEVVTNEAGEFEIPRVVWPNVELYISTVGYGLIKKKIQLQEGVDTDLEIYLGQEALKRSDEITVTTGVFDPIEPDAASEHTLNNTELKNLASVLADDPLRSVQTLPGVTTGDDFNSQFSIRGSGFRSVGFYIDGVLTSSPFHTVRDINDGASLTLLNGDLVESVSLLSGGFSAKYGDRTAAVLNVLTRDGGREKIFNRANLSATGLSFTSEGPLSKAQKASWLISARKSYLDYVISRITDDPSLAIGFYDVQGKLSYNPNDHHQLHFSVLHGDSGLDRERRRAQLGINALLRGDSRTDIYNLNWYWSPSPTTLLQSGAYITGETGRNSNRDQELLFHSVAQQVGFRQDLTHQLARKHKLETGIFVRRLEENLLRRNFDFSLNRFRVTDQYSTQTWQPGAYLQDSWQVLENRFSVTLGARYDRFNYTKENIWLPRASLSLFLFPKTRIAAAFGQYSEFPDFMQLFGGFPSPALHAERSTHYILGVEHLLAEKVRFRVEAYNLETKNGIFSPQTEFRILDGRIKGRDRGAVLSNSLRGYSRGVEFLLQRRSANKLSGWISYNLGFARFHDDLSQLRFDSDFDQRHTFNLYGSYRLTKTLNFSAKYRYGSNFPIVGFYRSMGSVFFLSEQRNTARIPAYSRLDFRINKAFYFDRWKMTLYGEVINLLNRRNYRYTDLIGINLSTGEVFLQRNSLFPILPSAGITIEF